MMSTRRMPKAYSYIRFSTALQAQGDGLHRQFSALFPELATSHKPQARDTGSTAQPRN